MNDRDWVDWAAIVFSALSSLGIIVSVVIYLCQKSSENKKQKEIDIKLLHFINIKCSDFTKKINRVLHLIENENQYNNIIMENSSLRFVEHYEDQNSSFYKIELKLKNKDGFLDRHGMQASLDLFKFIIEIDSLSEEFINKTSWYITYGHEYIGNYIPEISDNFQVDVERSLLIDFLNKTKDTIKLKLNKFSIR
ncbi:hypothetical protein AB7W62_13940 [Morganella morganii]|uniref:hypothetical protein n=1 Tax=Morganella morganii TaxID=582 RepID=UPI0031ABEA0B